MTMKICIHAIFLLLWVVQPIHAQSHQLRNTRDRAISLGFTNDAFTGLELGYAQNPGILQEKDLRVYVRCTIPILLASKNKSLQTWEVNLGANTTLLETVKFRMTGDVQCYLMHHRQVLGKFVPLGFVISLTPSYQFSKGYLGLQIHWDQTVATHISHSSYVQETFDNLSLYDGVQTDSQATDGWFGFTGSHFGMGVEGGREIGSRLFLYGDLGIVMFTSPFTGLLDAMMFGQVPVFGELRLMYAL